MFAFPHRAGGLPRRVAPGGDVIAPGYSRDLRKGSKHEDSGLATVVQ